MKINTYAVSLTAQKKGVVGMDVAHTATIIFATNDEEAMGKGISKAKEVFPEVEGYINHQASPNMLDDYVIAHIIRINS